jgi:hypothetical protein
MTILSQPPWVNRKSIDGVHVFDNIPGISLVLICHFLGKLLFDPLQNQIIKKLGEIIKLIQFALVIASPGPDNRGEFWDGYLQDFDLVIVIKRIGTS